MRSILNTFAEVIKTNKRYLRILLLSILIGVIVGMAAVAIKGGVREIEHLISKFNLKEHDFLYPIMPVLGIVITIFFVRLIVRDTIGAGISNVLYSINKRKGRIKRHNIFSSLVSSIITVGFGGSAGLEGPTITTGAAMGSNIGRILRLKEKELLILIGCASAGAISSIFKAPVAGVIFAIEVLLLELTLTAVAPLILASISSVLISFIFFGQESIYTIILTDKTYHLSNLLLYALLGICCGIISVGFSSIYIKYNDFSRKIGSGSLKIAIGTMIVGAGIYLFPSLAGEGFQYTNDNINGEVDDIFNNSIFERLKLFGVPVLLLAVIVITIKMLITSATLASGGVGGVFAPSLFIGSTLGISIAKSLENIGFGIDRTNFALAGMAGLIAGVIHAPLTAIFLIAELTTGYYLIVPLMIVSIVSYGMVKMFHNESIYTYQLVQKGLVITRHKDKATINKLSISGIIENDFLTVNPDCPMDELHGKLKNVRRNVFPVIDESKRLVGILTLNDIREYVFDRNNYEDLKVGDIMYYPETMVDYNDSIEDIVNKFEISRHYNIPVLKNGTYIGCISKVRLFETYRNHIKEVSYK
ncbi:MAG: chloride channel protein [Cytophagales bacterium]|nr:chloride channel protein [Cytophagales bacterium]